MKTINLKVYYPDEYTHDQFIEVTDEVAMTLIKSKRKEAAYLRRLFRYNAHYSLDQGDGIENIMLMLEPSPHDDFEKTQLQEQLWKAIDCLPEKQRQRIHSYYFLGMTMTEIAENEGVDRCNVSRSIDKGEQNIKIFLKNWL